MSVSDLQCFWDTLYIKLKYHRHTIGVADAGQSTGGDSEGYERYSTEERKNDSFFEKRKASVDSRKGRFSLHDRWFFCTGSERYNAAVRGIRCEKIEGVRSDWRAAMDMVQVMGNDKIETIVGLLKDIVEEQCWNLIDYESRLQFVKSQ